MDEFEAMNILREKRKEIKSLDGLLDFIKDVSKNYNTGYGTAPRSIAQASVAVADYLLGSMGCTGFQAGCTMWDFITELMYPNNKCGLRLVDYDEMLYPQYEYKFTDKEISKESWEAMQKTAKDNLLSNEYATPRVVQHWQNIADGVVPFGFTVED